MSYVKMYEEYCVLCLRERNLREEKALLPFSAIYDRKVLDGKILEVMDKIQRLEKQMIIESQKSL